MLVEAANRDERASEVAAGLGVEQDGEGGEGAEQASGEDPCCLAEGLGDGDEAQDAPAQVGRAGLLGAGDKAGA